ncbi:MAG TPA: HAD family acid phosphatase [Thermoanaerobaculia bacterium]|nr:HAD family acid phosphatase [Thermoanaerobaculia bacterium]
MRRLAPAVLVLLAACATTPAPAPAPTPEPAPQVATAPQCNPGHSIVNAVVWAQSSAEHDAATLGIYANARRALDAALADPTWVGAAEETSNDPSQPPAIVLDLDETAIDNSPFEAGSIKAGKTYDDAIWKEWAASGAALAIPGAPEFLAYAKSRGVTPFYVTNRDKEEEPGVRHNLETLGYPLTTDRDNLLLRGEQADWTSDKTSRRAFVASSYRILLLLGDDLNDFTNAREKTVAERDAIVAERRDWWGTRWFMIPNPMYGSWERALIGTTGTPCEQVQRKIEALKP